MNILDYTNISPELNYIWNFLSFVLHLKIIALVFLTEKIFVSWLTTDEANEARGDIRYNAKLDGALDFSGSTSIYRP